MKWSSLFSRKRSEFDDMVAVNSQPGFRFVPYTLVIAVALLVISFYSQPLAQDGEGTPEPPAVVATHDIQDVATEDVAATEEVAAEEVAIKEATPVQLPELTAPIAAQESQDPVIQLPEGSSTLGTGEVGQTATPNFTTPEGFSFSPETFTPDNPDLLQGLSSMLGTPVDVEAGPITTGPADEQAEDQVEGKPQHQSTGRPSSFPLPFSFSCLAAAVF